MMRGLPGCGKTTYAMELVAKGYKRFNKDDLRAMIDNSEFSKSNENIIKDSEKYLAKKFIEQGYNVVIDNTNFGYESFWEDFAKEMNADFEVQFIDTPYYECLKRNAARTGRAKVPEKSITYMYEKYLKPKLIPSVYNLADCYIFDIDGTLAKMNGRSPYDYTKVDTDIVNRDVFEVYHKLAQHIPIIIMSGRESSCRNETMKWLEDNGIIYTDLFMRAEGDDRNDAIVKKELYEQHVKGQYNVLGVFDDRDRVVAMWRSLGLTCFQVDYGAF